MDHEQQSQRFIDYVDHDTRENIIKLDQKLRVLKAEITAKLASSSWSQDDNSEETNTHLSHIEREIDQAIEGISTLVNLVNNNNSEKDSRLFFQSDEMQEFSKNLSENLDVITQLTEKF